MMVATKKIIPATDISDIQTSMATVVSDISVANNISAEYVREASMVSFSNPASIDKFGEKSSNILSNMSKDANTSETKLKQLGEVGDRVTSLMKIMNSLDPKILKSATSSGFLSKLFNKIKDPIETFSIQQKSVKESAKAISSKLMQDRDFLLKENDRLERVYNNTLQATKDLEELIKAGALRLQELKSELVELKAIADTDPTNDEKVLAVRNAQNTVDRFEQKLDRMNVMRALTLRTLPKIKSDQNTNSEEANTCLDCATILIPQWENDMDIYISELRTAMVMDSRKAVVDMVNKNLVDSANLSYENAVRASEASNSSLVTLETIQTVHNKLIESLNVKVQSAERGRELRAQNFMAIMDMDKNLREELAKINS